MTHQSHRILESDTDQDVTQPEQPISSQHSHQNNFCQSLSHRLLAGLFCIIRLGVAMLISLCLQLACITPPIHGATIYLMRYMTPDENDPRLKDTKFNVSEGARGMHALPVVAIYLLMKYFLRPTTPGTLLRHCLLLVTLMTTIQWPIMVLEEKHFVIIVRHVIYDIIWTVLTSLVICWPWLIRVERNVEKQSSKENRTKIE